MFGVQQPGPELAPEVLVRQDPLAVDLVFERRFLERALLRVVVEHLQEIVGTKFADLRFWRNRDLKIGLDAIDVLWPDQTQRAIEEGQSSPNRCPGQRQIARRKPP